MAYFRNNAVNLLNLHYGIHAVAMTGGGAFYTIYLYKSGVPIPYVLGAMALILAGRFIVRPAIVPLAARVGLRPLVITGNVIGALQYLLLARVNGLGLNLLALCLVSSVGDTLYWTSYHAYFAALGDHEHRGHQISMREAITAVVGIVSPLVTGWVLLLFGPIVAFAVTASIQLSAALPLFFTPKVSVARHVPGALRASLLGVKLFFADGWTAPGFFFLWQIVLFVTLGKSYVGYGGALAVAALAGAVGGLLLGRHIDAGYGKRAVWLAYTGFAAVVSLRAASLGNPPLAVIANALGSLSSCLYVPTMMTAVYNTAKSAPCTLRFHAATEGGWDLGGAVGCLVAATLVWFGAPLPAVLLMPLFGLAASFWMLRDYYTSHRVEIDTALTDAAGG
jgi:hypothetical protein